MFAKNRSPMIFDLKNVLQEIMPCGKKAQAFENARKISGKIQCSLNLASWLYIIMTTDFFDSLLAEFLEV